MVVGKGEVTGIEGEGNGMGHGQRKWKFVWVSHSQGPPSPGAATPSGRHSQGAPLYLVSKHFDPVFIFYNLTM